MNSLLFQTAKAFVESCKTTAPEQMTEACDTVIHYLTQQGCGRGELREFSALVGKILKREKASEIAVLTTPTGHAGEHRGRIEAAFDAALGQSVSLQEADDSTLIGGAMLSYGDERFDASVRGALSNAEEHLALSFS
jgi:hypothetical protein